MISLLLPTRGRPHLMKDLVASYRENSHNKEQNELLIYLQNDDNSVPEYVNVFQEINLKQDRDFFILNPYPTGHMWNLLADKAKGDLLCLMGDDVVIETPGWDRQIEEAAKKYQDNIFVIAVNDGRSPDPNHLGCPHPVLHRRWKEILGFFMPPMFMHRYLDRYTAHLAIQLDRFIQLPDVMFKHNKKATKRDSTGKLSRTWCPLDAYNWNVSQRYFQHDLELLRKHIK